MRTINYIIPFIAVVVGAMLFAGCGQKQAEIEKLKASYIQASENAYNKGEVNALDKIFAADFVRHQPPEPDIKGLEAYKQFIIEGRHTYSDVQLTINSMIMEGNISATRWTFQTTEMSTGKQMKITGCTMNQWANGKVVEQWRNGDDLGMYQQLGYKLIPPITQNTFARVTLTQGKPDKMNETVKIYKDSVVPAAKSQKGFRGIILLDDFKNGKGISISIWDNEADAIANEQSGYYQTQLGKFKDLLTAKPVKEGYTVTVQE